MEFNPGNNVVKLCLRGMAMEEKGLDDEARKYFCQAWSEAQYDFEKFISAHYVARTQDHVSAKLKWLKKALSLAIKINDDSVKSALPFLYSDIAECYKSLNETENANTNYEMAKKIIENPTDKGPFYHGTKAFLKVGEMLTAGRKSNYESDLKMNHIYFTALASVAGLSAALAQGDGKERVYIVEPTGFFENDPNVTNKKFPGNPTRSYRSQLPLRIIGEMTDWKKQSADVIDKFRTKSANIHGEIIN